MAKKRASLVSKILQAKIGSFSDNAHCLEDFFMMPKEHKSIKNQNVNKLLIILLRSNYCTSLSLPVYFSLFIVNIKKSYFVTSYAQNVMLYSIYIVEYEIVTLMLFYF